MADAATDSGPRDRLLQAAAELFAARGYDGTAVRGIVARAGTNLNAVNYYFGGKRALYLEVMRSQFALNQKATSLQPGAAGQPESLQARLHGFVLATLRRFLDSRSLLPRLTALEILNPSPAFDELIATAHADEQRDLTLLVREALGPQAPPERVSACVRSVLSQCVYYLFMRDALLRTQPQLSLERAAVERIAVDITEFSVAAMRGLATHH